MNIKTLDTIDVRGKRVLLRCDLNVPLKAGVITDDGRIKASLPTIKYLLAQGASVVITAHLGRPKGERVPELSLAPVAQRLSELLGESVNFSSEIIGAKIAPTGVTLLENIRYEAAETSKDETQRTELAGHLASYADVFVSDGFGAVHRYLAEQIGRPAKRAEHADFDFLVGDALRLGSLRRNDGRGCQQQTGRRQAMQFPCH